MKLQAGQTVLLKQTRERASVIAPLQHDHYLVETLLDKERFPVSVEDLEPVLSGVGAAAKRSPNESQDELALRIDEGRPAIQLAFIPFEELDYRCALLNFSTDQIVYAVRLLSKKGQQWSRHGLLMGGRGVFLGELYRDLLNEHLVAEFQISRKTAQGTDSKQQRNINIKPKLFYKNTVETDWYEGEVTTFYVFDQTRIENKIAPDLQSYTRKKLEESQLAGDEGKPSAPKVRPSAVFSAAAFRPEIDLHLEALVDDPHGMQLEDIIKLQMTAARDHVDLAIRMGIDKVYLIHGKGTGSLRNRLHQWLATLGDIESFNNDYHPKYEFGATEVILRG